MSRFHPSVERRSEARLKRPSLVSALERKRDGMTIWLDAKDTHELNRKLRMKKNINEEILRHRASIVRADILHQVARELVRTGKSKGDALRVANRTVDRDTVDRVLKDIDDDTAPATLAKKAREMAAAIAGSTN